MIKAPWQELAEKVIAADPHGDKESWGRAFLVAATDDQIRQWLDGRELAHTGNYVSGVHAREENQRASERRLSNGVATATGRPISPTLSVRDDSGRRRLMLWIDASPTQFVEAVQVEQRVAEGRLSANAVRVGLAEAMKDDDDLMAMDTLAEVCAALDVDPDTLGLDDLGEAAS